MNYKSLLWTMLRVAIGATLIILLLRRANVAELTHTLSSSIWWVFIVSNAIACARVIIIAYRLQIILRLQGVKLSVWRLMYLCLISGFFSLFLPTSAGGDLVRIYEIAKQSGRKADAAASVLLDRMIGMAALGMICLVVLVPNVHAIVGPKVFTASLVASAVCLAMLGLVMHPGVNGLAIGALSRLPQKSITKKLQNGYESLATFSGHKQTIARALSISVMFHVIGIYCIYLIGLSLGLQTSLIYFLVFVPLIWLMTMLPLTICGIGVRESSFVLLFTSIGVAKTQALSLAFLAFGQVIIVGLVGGAAYLLHTLLQSSVKQQSPCPIGGEKP